MKIEQDLMEDGAETKDLTRAFDLVWECEAVVEEIKKELMLLSMKAKKNG